ncbi:CARDB domain-containing protein [Clostridium thermarum]|uniref:CARDB domain-containing protein n=1 Tax=Clostridium thermarum TaxID=1716543 RepID=UPI00111D4E6E|nr:CARDB domain-containing protein [Clostridium thermarum]
MSKALKKCAIFMLALAVLLFQNVVFFPTVYAADTSNLALGKPITASSVQQTYVATNANDGNVNTYWEGAPGTYPNTLTVDLGSVQSVYKLVLKLNTSWGSRTQTLSVLSSTDNTNYTTRVASATYTFNPSSGNTVTITFTETNARYIRLNFTANSGATGGQAAELEVYGTAPSGTPDLVVTDISWNPANPAAGNAVTFSATIKNQGTGTKTAGIINGVSFMVNGTQVSWSDNNTSALAPGESITVTANGGPSGSATWTATSGSHTITAWVDDVNRIAESNENNNQYSESLTVGSSGGSGTPDLIVTDITTSPATPLTGNLVRFSAVVKNQGTGATPAGTIIGVSFFVDGTQVSWSDNTTSSLAPGASVTVTANGGPSGSATWTATTGNHTVMAWVDDVNRINETNENNNQYSKNIPVTTAPMPDLVVTNLTCSPASPVTGDPVTFTATVKNEGTAAGAPGVVSFKVDGTQVYASPSNTTPLAAGATTTVTGTWTATTVGSHTVTATVDNANITSEGNENNNTYSTSLTVNPKPGVDLIITSISWSPSYVTAGNTVTFSAVVKNQGTTAGSAGTVVFRVNGSQVASVNSSASIAAGSSITVNGSGSWTASSGTHVVTATVDSNNTIAETDETNNSFSTNLSVGSGGRGATMPYTRYESEDATIGGGAILRSAPDFNYALTASEASNQKYVELPTAGSYVQWTINQGGAGVTMRFTMPDSSDGMGLNGSLDCYVNGVKVKTISLTSYFMYQYFQGDQPGDAPNGGQPAFRFDETHWLLSTPLKAGDVLRIQKSGDSLVYGVDFVEVEPVPDPIAQPANSLSVTAYGAVPNDGIDDLAAFTAAVNAAAAQGKILYIPAGTFHLNNMWVIGSVQNPLSAMTITGTGIWYTNLQFTNPNAQSGGISLRMAPTGKLDFGHVYINSNLRSRYGQNAVYKCFMDNFGTNSRIHDFWEEHFECGFWVGDYAHTPAIPADGLVIENGRIRNNLADGVNFCQGTKNSVVRNCSVRNNGDDGLAIWPDSTMGAPMAVNNSFLYNTIENNWRAAAIAIFGGSGHQARYNYIKDCFMGSGIRLNTVFPGYHFENNTGILFSDTTIINSGTSKDCYNGERGAIDLEASATSIKNITFENIDIINSQRDAIQFGYSGGFSGILFKKITIDGTGKDSITTSRFYVPHLGTAIYTYTSNGSATFTNLVLRNIEADPPHLIMNGFVVTFN